jgi:hypothetical protein
MVKQRRERRLAAWAALSMLSLGSVMAEEPARENPTVLSPAHFTDDPKSLQNRIRFPSNRPDEIVDVFCEARLSSRGAFRNTFCKATKPGLYGYELASAMAARTARIAPAILDGEPREIWFQYRVEFEKKAGRESIRAYANQARQITTYGPDYTSPQRLLPLDTGPTYRAVCQPGLQVWAHATISVTGEAEAVSVKPGSRVSGSCRRLVTDDILKSRYIPAHADGVPVRALYMEVFF